MVLARGDVLLTWGAKDKKFNNFLFHVFLFFGLFQFAWLVISSSLVVFSSFLMESFTFFYLFCHCCKCYWGPFFFGCKFFVFLTFCSSFVVFLFFVIINFSWGIVQMFPFFWVVSTSCSCWRQILCFIDTNVAHFFGLIMGFQGYSWVLGVVHVCYQHYQAFSCCLCLL